jgi:serine/threonine protein kinase
MEEFIIPIAREVAVALKYVHDAGIVHRDVKCANILVTEDGRIQLCDFGISGVLENQVSKRTTIIGTPHWMAPEIVEHLGAEFPGVSYGAEIDCWAFGCAVFEMATGRPPNANVPPHKLGLTLNLRAPRLDAAKYPEGLCDFTAFCLEQQPEQRPKATQIMSHPYIFNTEDQYPTSRITRLIENFAMWEQEGGQRSSLFDPNLGAQGPDELSASGPEEEWNFSTTADFDRRISMRFDGGFDISSPGPAPGRGFNFMEEQRSKRGEAALNRLFDQSAKPYAYGERRSSDLPLRDYQDMSTGNRETMINLDDIGLPDFNLPNLSLLDPPTLRPGRKRIDSDTSSEEAPFQTARRTTQDWTSGFSGEPPDERKPRPPTMAWSFADAQKEANVGDVPDTSDVITPPAVIHETARKSTLKPSDRTAKRGTMAWNFAEAQQEAASMPKHHSSFTTSDAVLEPARPPLRHATTMPVESSFTTTESSSPERGSMINLDDALEISIPDLSRRPSVAHSATGSAVTDMTQGDPFDLEEQLELSKEASRTSLHMKSQSEPTTGFLEGKGSKDDSSSLYGSDIDSAIHNRSSSLNQPDRSDRDRSTSRPPGGAATRLRPRRPTALQRHIADRQRMPTSSDSTVPSSRGGSFDSTGSTAPVTGHTHNLSFGASDEEMRKEETRIWSQVRSQHRRQKTSDGASTIASNASRSDSEGITMRPSTRPSRMVGNWKPAKGADGYIMPYEPDKRLLLPDPPDDLATREFSRLWFNLQAMNSQNAESLEKEYGPPIDDAELEAEFGPRSMWAAAGSGKLPIVVGGGGGDENDNLRYGEASTLRSEI